MVSLKMAVIDDDCDYMITMSGHWKRGSVSSCWRYEYNDEDIDGWESFYWEWI